MWVNKSICPSSFILFQRLEKYNGKIIKYFKTLIPAVIFECKIPKIRSQDVIK